MVSRPSPEEICDRFADIPSDAPLTIRPLSVAIDDEVEEWIALDVSGFLFYAIPREGFLDAFHHVVHELTDDDD